MICFRDMTYCSDADQCANKTTCMRWFSPSEEAASVRWWGGNDAPVALRPMAHLCEKYKELKG